MSGNGRGVRLSEGEDNVEVRVKFPISLKTGMDNQIAHLNSQLDPKEKKIDTSKYLRDLVKDDLDNAP